MQFDVPLHPDTTSSDALTSVVRHIRNKYPDARILNHLKSTPRSLSPINDPWVSVIFDEDSILAIDLFDAHHAKVPSALTISCVDGTLCFRPNPKAVDMARELAKMPVWSHKVESERLKSVEL